MTRNEKKQPESVADFKLRLSAIMRGQNQAADEAALDYRNSPNRAPECVLRNEGDAPTPSEVGGS